MIWELYRIISCSERSCSCSKSLPEVSELNFPGNLAVPSINVLFTVRCTCSSSPSITVAPRINDIDGRPAPDKQISYKIIARFDGLSGCSLSPSSLEKHLFVVYASATESHAIARTHTRAAAGTEKVYCDCFRRQQAIGAAVGGEREWSLLMYLSEHA